MQALIPLIATLSVVSGVQLLPYTFLVDPLPVLRQYQNTRTGEHAYSYSGGPSAKEEIKDASGVTRGSYSYVDANGILQSVFYVADENGFRVAATDLPSENNINLEAAHILVARDTKSAAIEKSSRRKRSAEVPSQSEQKEKSGAADSILLQSLVPTATSHQSQVQIHKNYNLEPAKTLVRIDTEPLYQPLLLPSAVPLATSHQSQVQVHGNVRVNLSEVTSKAKPLDGVSQTLFPLGQSEIQNYLLRRQQLNKELQKFSDYIDKQKLKEAQKQDFVPIGVPISPVIPTVIAKDAVPVLPVAQLYTPSITTSISQQSISQIHPSKIPQISIPSAGEAIAPESSTLAPKEDMIIKSSTDLPPKEKAVPENIAETVPLKKDAAVASESLAPSTTASISSYEINQIHGPSKVKLEPTLLVNVAPITQLHSVVDLPVYIH